MSSSSGADSCSIAWARDDVAATSRRPAKAIVEHTAINPNKAAHIGHLRNSALGDTLVRVLRFRGIPVEVQNYIDDTGVQVADVVVGFRVLEQQDARRDPRNRGHHAVRLLLLGPVRARHRVVRRRQGTPGAPDRDAARHRAAAATRHAEIGAFIADRIVRCHLKTMARLNVDYDLLTWEGDILRLKFWAQAFDVLKASGAVYLQTEGRLAGCWVMPIQDDPESKPKAQGHRAQRDTAPTDEGEDTEEREKVIVRSNGVVTYVGKDIAYQFWKLGLLGTDFQYRVFTSRPARPAVGDLLDGRRERSPAVRRRQLRLQRHRRPAVVSPEAAEAGARRRRASRRRRTVAPLLVRDGGAVARDRARARVSRRRQIRRTRSGRSSRSRAARASASRPTTCSIR